MSKSRKGECAAGISDDLENGSFEVMQAVNDLSDRIVIGECGRSSGDTTGD